MAPLSPLPSLSLPFSFLSFSLGRLTSAIDESLRGSCEGSLSLLYCLFTLINSLNSLWTLISHLPSLTHQPLIPSFQPLSSPRSYLGAAAPQPSIANRLIHPIIKTVNYLTHVRFLYCTLLYCTYCTSINPPTATIADRRTRTALYVRHDTEPNHISRRHSID